MDIGDVVVIYKKYVEPFLAVFVLLGLAYALFMLHENYQAKKDIAKECGWAEEDVRCWCQKGDVVAWENRMRGELGEVIFDVPVGG